MGLGVGTLLLTWWLVAAAISDDAFATVQWFLGYPDRAAAAVRLDAGAVLPLLHRHPPSGLGCRATASRSLGTTAPRWAVLIATGVATLLLWIVGLAVW